MLCGRGPALRVSDSLEPVIAMRKTTYTLEMTSPEQLRPKRSDQPGLRIERVTVAFPELSKFLHTVVGHEYRWGGRADRGREEYLAHCTREEVVTA